MRVFSFLAMLTSFVFMIGLNVVLFEEEVMYGIGGIIGIIFGISASVIVCKLMGIGVSISITSIVVAFGVSAGIGVMFGYFPASKASKLNPIEALRHD